MILKIPEFLGYDELLSHNIRVKGYLLTGNSCDTEIYLFFVTIVNALLRLFLGQEFDINEYKKNPTGLRYTFFLIVIKKKEVWVYNFIK